MTYIFRKSNISEIMHLINEADQTDSFLQMRNDDKPVVENLLKYFNNQNDFNVFVLENYKSNDLAGFATTLPAKENKSIYLGPIYITKTFRGKGLGALLLNKLISWCKLYFDIIYTQTWETNFTSQRMLEKAGFIKYDVLKNTRINGENSICYRLKINIYTKND